nr:hypothetical protein [Physocyclus mexicanus]
MNYFIISAVASLFCLTQGGTMPENTAAMKEAYHKALCGEDKEAVLSCLRDMPEQVKEIVMKEAGTTTFNDGLLKICDDVELDKRMEAKLNEFEWPEEEHKKIMDCLTPLYQKYGAL